MDNYGIPEEYELAADMDSGWAAYIKVRLREPAMRIARGRIYYKLRQQDGSMQATSCADTLDNRRYVRWVLFRENQFQWRLALIGKWLAKIDAGAALGIIATIAIIAALVM